MAKTSIKGAARDAIRDDQKARSAVVRMLPDGSATSAVTDSFVNFAQKLGLGADNALSTGSYAINPITRQRTLLEWMHRSSWLAGRVIDSVADDMTRAGIEYVTELPPEQSELLDKQATLLGIWTKTNETVKWSRLYGGAVAVMLVDGQDLSTPLRLETVGPKQFRGILPLDRWMLDPVLEDLVTEFGPYLGLPKFYRVGSNAPALRNKVIHYSRLAFRLEGIQLPYQQRLTENLWGISVLERLYDRMISYDTASTGVAQLVGKSFLRTLKIDGMREVVSSGGPAMDGLIRYTEMMRRFQGNEGITLLDMKDEFEVQSNSAFSGLSDVLIQFAQQLSGASEIPLTRLFGQAPAGLNATGDNDMRNYYDSIKQRQQKDLHIGMTRVYKLIAASEGVELPPNFEMNFRSLWQLTETDKATIAKTSTETITSAFEAGLTSAQTTLQELRALSRITGVWTNITTELIEAAETELQPPMGEGMIDPETGMPMTPPGGPPGAGGPPQPGEPKPPAGEPKEKSDGAEVRPEGKESPVGPRQVSRKKVQRPSEGGGEAD